MELCLNPHLIKKWKKMTRKELKEAKKIGKPFDPSSILEVNFLRNLIDEFLEVSLKLPIYCHNPSKLSCSKW